MMSKKEITDDSFCPCPKTSCKNNKNCQPCIKKHKDTDSLPYCLFPSKDKSNKAYFEHLKARFL